MVAFKETLGRLGFSTYREYLQSDLWKRIRARVMSREGGKCRVCGVKATQVHHKDYGDEVMAGEDLKRLVPLCGKHHDEIEWCEGRKCKLYEANRRLRAIAQAVAPKAGKKRKGKRRHRICTKCGKVRCKTGKTLCKFCKRPKTRKKPYPQRKPPTPVAKNATA